MSRETLVFTLSAAILGLACSPLGVDCAPLVDDGSRCVCPEGTVQIDDWVCELPDGGTIERPGRPDVGVDAAPTTSSDGAVDASDAASSLDAGDDAGRENDGAVDGGEQDGGVDAGVDAPLTPPDLLVACVTPPSVVGVGEDVAVEYEVINLGGEPARDFVLRLVGPARTRLGNVAEPVTLAEERVLLLGGGANRVGTLRFVVPDRIMRGESPMDCVVDATDVVSELDETNNTDRRLLTATGREELSVSGTLPATLMEGQRVEFVISNTGPVTSTEIQWQFYGQIGASSFTMDDCELNVDCPFLRPGASVRLGAFARIPVGGGSGSAGFSANAAPRVSRAVTFVP